MRITFHGAAQTVTGSQHLLTINGANVLLDCGLFQGPRAESYERNRNFGFQATAIDAVILSHAHIDHSGNLPHLVKRGFDGPIFATPATCDLAEVMLRDSGHIHESDAAYLNKKRRRRGEPPVEPLYTIADAERVGGMLIGVPYGEEFNPAPGVTARFVDAGHILGSASVGLRLEEKGQVRHLWFSGDIGRVGLPLIRDPQMPDESDEMIMECTYGDKPHRDPELAFNELRDVVKRTVERGGKVIIPAFAVGRTQELVYGLNQMISSGDLPRLPVFVDSPLAVDVSAVFQRHPDCFDAETRQFMRSGKARQALGFDLLTYVRSVDESKALNERRDPMVIISASGMAETGRILHHLKNNVEDKRNTVLIVSWQAPHTLGRRLAEKADYIKIFGETYTRRADVSTIGGLSAHAGQDLLVKYAMHLDKRVRNVFLVHGESGPAAALMSRLSSEGFSGRMHYPERGSSIDL